MIDLNLIKNYLSKARISFLIDFDKTIDIDKRGKSYYFKSNKIEAWDILNFLLLLSENEVYLINPFISIFCRINEPYLTLSRQFLVTKNSNVE